MEGSILGRGFLSVGNDSTPAKTVDITGDISSLQSVSIHGSDVTISGSISSLANVPGNSPGIVGDSYSGGGAHGGSAGGVDSTYVRRPYGSFRFPNLPGSKGGPAPEFIRMLFFFFF